jgi:protein involved in polysaccharide export with SLBB domain
MCRHFAVLAVVFLLEGAMALRAADSPPGEPAPKPASPPVSPAAVPSQEASRLYVLKPNDLIMVKVYQEDDLTTQARIARDGSITLPLLGTVNLSSNTVEQAVGVIRELLAKDYLVNPQVSLTVVEYAKRRYTVLGQVNRPGAYEMPSDDRINLLQAIATAGGYTRVGNPKKVTVQRMVDGETKVFRNLDAQAMAEDKKAKPFEVLPDDTITVGEKWI